ncbi:hypothetical protein [Immundisolibacter sp.]
MNTPDNRQARFGARRPSRWLLAGLAIVVVAIYAFTIWAQQHG